MAVTISRYNHTRKKFLNKEVTLTTLKIILLSDDATFNPSHTTLSQVTNSGAYQVSGNGWPSGGVTLDNVAVTTVDTDGAMIDADDVSETATGGDIGPAYKAVIYDDTDSNDAPLWFIDFDGAESAPNGNPFEVAFSSSGIARILD